MRFIGVLGALLVLVSSSLWAQALDVSYEVTRPNATPLKFPIVLGQLYPIDLPQCVVDRAMACERTFVVTNSAASGATNKHLRLTSIVTASAFEVEVIGALNSLLAPQAEMKFKIKQRRTLPGNIYSSTVRLTFDHDCSTTGTCALSAQTASFPVASVYWKKMAAAAPSPSPSASPSPLPTRGSVVDEIASLTLARDVQGFVQIKSKLTLLPEEKVLFAAIPADASPMDEWLKDFIIAYNRADLSLGARWLMYCLTETTASAGQAYLESKCSYTLNGVAGRYGQFIPATATAAASWRNLNFYSDPYTVLAKKLIETMNNDADAKARSLLLVALAQIPVTQQYLRFYLQKALSFDLAAQTPKLNPLGRSALRVSFLHTFFLCRPGIQDVMVLVNPLLEKLDDPMVKAPLHDLVLKSYPEILLRNW